MALLILALLQRIFLYFQAEDGIRYRNVTGVQTCALPILLAATIPVPVYAPDEVKRHDLQLSATYVPTGVSTITGHLNVTRETHTLDSRPDFSGVTGGVTWDYHLLGRLNFSASLSRDTGTATTSVQPLVTLPVLPSTVRVDTNRLSTVATLGFNYEATAKIQLNGNLRRVNSSDGGSAGQSTSSYGLGATYAPTRTVGLGCNVSRETRSSVYSDNTVGCNASLTFR